MVFLDLYNYMNKCYMLVEDLCAKPAKSQMA